MLSKEQLSILKWLKKAPAPATFDEMKCANLSGLSVERLEELRCAELMKRSTPTLERTVYSITDRGAAALRSESSYSFTEFRAWATLAIALLSLLLSILALIG